MADRSQFRGCLLAGAIGDALGAAVEFQSRSQIVARFGLDGVREFVPAYGKIGAVTDDTQMLLFTAEGLLRAHNRAAERGFVSYVGVVSNAYLRWYRTQGSSNPIEVNAQHPGWLFEQPDMHHVRAPGNTCLSALSSMRKVGERASNNSKGCGTVMRIAPVGLFASQLTQLKDDSTEAFQWGMELSWVTHNHPSGYLAGAALAQMIFLLARGVELRDTIAPVLARLAQEEGHEETTLILKRAVQLADSDMDRVLAVESLGLGWIAEEALAISVYCALVESDLLNSLSLAVSHSGDSDSTGAITGNILGLIQGEKCLPENLLQTVELRDVIYQIADDLYDFPTWNQRNRPARYPGC